MTNYVDHEQKPTDPTDTQQSMDELFDVLSHARRRNTLSILSDRDGAVDVASLATTLATRETDDPDEETIQTVHVRLHHVHLPKLAEADLVTYDRDAKTVAISDAEAAGVPIEIE